METGMCSYKPCALFIITNGEIMMTEIIYLKNGICRIRAYKNKPPRESLMTKYKILKTEFEEENVNPFCALNEKQDRLTLTAKKYELSVKLDCGEDNRGFDIMLTLSDDERLFGLGDESRSCIMKRGHTAQIKQENVHSYGPIPYVMSSRGWGLLVNCTYPHTFDLGHTAQDILRIHSSEGALDFFVFMGGDMQEALKLYTEVSGRPVMLPKGAYGLTFVMNEDANARTLLDDALRFKEKNIPCDILGLEPSWMSRHYDDTTEKKWNREKFDIPGWQPENYYGSWSFIYNLHKMGYMLSLWLCISYDLFWKEENDTFNDKTNNYADAGINDAHFTSGIRMDKVTKKGESWFEHLKKFVDNGAEAFKLDGSSQIIPFPDRLWAGRYTDNEIRNIYPLVYAKQMKEGYEDHTGKRAMINTCGTYAGTQQYAATWAGDTGCNPRVLVSLMNFAMCGHSNTSFDMTAEDEKMIHFGFLAPWSQHQGWANWLYPWYLDRKTEDTYRYYAQLRSSLFPYIYSSAYNAYETALPILRPLSLVYLDTDKYDSVLNEYMFGDSFLVSAFDEHIILPGEDDWYDFFTGEKHSGGEVMDYIPPESRGGALFVKAGSVIVTQDWTYSLRDHCPDRLYIHVYPGKNTVFTLYEDDGKTYAYEKGEFAKTRIKLKDEKLIIKRREGNYMGMKRVTPFRVVLHKHDGTLGMYNVTAEEHETGDVIIDFSIA